MPSWCQRATRQGKPPWILVRSCANWLYRLWHLQSLQSKTISQNLSIPKQSFVQMALPSFELVSFTTWHNDMSSQSRIPWIQPVATETPGKEPRLALLVPWSMSSRGVVVLEQCASLAIHWLFEDDYLITIWMMIHDDSWWFTELLPATESETLRQVAHFAPYPLPLVSGELGSVLGFGGFMSGTNVQHKLSRGWTPLHLFWRCSFSCATHASLGGKNMNKCIANIAKCPSNIIKPNASIHLI